MSGCSALTAGTTKAVRWRGWGANAALAEAVFPAEGDTLPGRKGLSERHRLKCLRSNTLFILYLFYIMHLLANGAHKAGRVVGLAQDRHHLTLYKLSAVVAEGAMEPLEVQRAEAVAVLREEAALGQVAAAHYRERHMTRFD